MIESKFFKHPDFSITDTANGPFLYYFGVPIACLYEPVLKRAIIYQVLDENFIDQEKETQTIYWFYKELALGTLE
jgi:hypothetical protein